MTIRIMTIRTILAAALTVAAAPVFAANLGISISLGEPGFYGRINIGDTKPDVIYARPVIVYREHSAAHEEPIYLHVPPGHEKHWRKHCHEYDACGRPVYFVKDAWYQEAHPSGHNGHDRDWDQQRSEHGDRHHGEGHWAHR